MADLNACSFTGRLTKDAEQKTLPTGTKLVTFSIANNTGWGDYAKTMFLDVNVWGKQGESILKYLNKGKPVALAGELEVQEWTSRDGIKQKKNVLKANSVILLADGGDKHKSSDVIDYEVIPEEDIAF